MLSIPVQLSNSAPLHRGSRLPDLAEVHQLLGLIKDPGIPALTIVDLGILRQVQLSGHRVLVSITPTYSGCPAIQGIEQEIRSLLIGSGYSVEIKTVLSPAWSSDWLTAAGRAKLKAYGIAPPLKCATQTQSLMAVETSIDCPRCDSCNTSKISEFGASSCKALYRCNDCQQPFDYFKCL